MSCAMEASGVFRFRGRMVSDGRRSAASVSLVVAPGGGGGLDAVQRVLLVDLPAPGELPQQRRRALLQDLRSPRPAACTR